MPIPCRARHRLAAVLDDDKPSPSRQRSWRTTMRAIDAGILV
ncbi:TPA: paraquat-inducible membrane protein A, partial [Pseudomonas aeruginosa]|nr:paraquat-inducible membrane protein A [Pseudomonas aeruginosa]